VCAEVVEIALKAVEVALLVEAVLKVCGR